MAKLGSVWAMRRRVWPRLASSKARSSWRSFGTEVVQGCVATAVVLGLLPSGAQCCYSESLIHGVGSDGRWQNRTSWSGV
jgi:hypothetical protein